MNMTKEFIKSEIVVNAPLKQVWEALTEPEHLKNWYTKEAEIDFREGGRGYMDHGWGAVSEGIFTEIDPMKRFVLQSDDGEFRTITCLVEADNGILVSIEYHSPMICDMAPSMKENMLFGTTQFLKNLKSVHEAGTDKRETFWKAWIGIVHSSAKGKIGTEVLQVKKGSAAETAEIKPNDIIVEMDGDKITGYEAFELTLNKRAVHSYVHLIILRKDKRISVNCMVDNYPETY